MNFFCDSGGNIFHVDSENVYQGSANANTIYFIGAFPSSSAVTLSFELPNGVVTEPKLCALANDSELTDIQSPNGKFFNVWVVTLDKVITQYFGTVSVQFQVYNNGGSETGVVLATALSSFNVLRGVPILLPNEPSEDIYTAILNAFSTLSGNVEELEQELEDIKENGVGGGGSVTPEELEEISQALTEIIEIQNALLNGTVGNIIYELTATDKTDIANIVLSELPIYDGAVEVGGNA